MKHTPIPIEEAVAEATPWTVMDPEQVVWTNNQKGQLLGYRTHQQQSFSPYYVAFATERDAWKARRFIYKHRPNPTPRDHTVERVLRFCQEVGRPGVVVCDGDFNELARFPVTLLDEL